MYRSIGQTFILTLAASAILAAQAPPAEGTRQLFYMATPANDVAPPPQHTNAAASHLGIRYNLVLVKDDHKSQQISSSQELKAGDCFAIDVQSNRAGYLYVLARQSSGSWTPLTDMPGQSQPLPAGKVMRIPKGTCFVVHNPPGTETMFVVLSRDQRDFFELYEDTKGQELTPRSPNNGPQPSTTHNLEAVVAHLDEKFGGTRDISIARVEEPQREDEPRGAVYVVSKKTSTSVVTKIEIHHR